MKTKDLCLPKIASISSNGLVTLHLPFPIRRVPIEEQIEEAEFNEAGVY